MRSIRRNRHLILSKATVLLLLQVLVAVSWRAPSSAQITSAEAAEEVSGLISPEEAASSCEAEESGEEWEPADGCAAFLTVSDKETGDLAPAALYSPGVPGLRIDTVSDSDPGDGPPPETDPEKEAADKTDWYQHYDYRLNKTTRKLTLKASKGIYATDGETSITVPAKTLIDDEVYTTVLDNRSHYVSGTTTRCGLWYEDRETIRSLTLADGVEVLYTMEYMFSDLNNLTELDISHLDTSQVTTIYNMFKNCSSLTEIDLSCLNTEKLGYAAFLFDGCTSLRKIDLSGFHAENIKILKAMFQNCSSLKSLDLSGFHTTSATNLSYMFFGCTSLETLDLSGFETGNTETMETMFYNCKSLETLDVSHFRTENVKNMGSMFNQCQSLKTLDISGFDTSQVTDMRSLFNHCESLTGLSLSGFDTSQVTDMQNMFNLCGSLEGLDLRSFDTSHVTNVQYMFYRSLVPTACLDISSFDLGLAQETRGFLAGTSPAVLCPPKRWSDSFTASNVGVSSYSPINDDGTVNTGENVTVLQMKSGIRYAYAPCRVTWEDPSEEGELWTETAFYPRGTKLPEKSRPDCAGHPFQGWRVKDDGIWEQDRVLTERSMILQAVYAYISFSLSDTVLISGGTPVSVEATVIPASLSWLDVHYTSSDSNVLMVTPDEKNKNTVLLTPMHRGYATLTMSADDGGDLILASCEITVTEKLVVGAEEGADIHSLGVDDRMNVQIASLGSLDQENRKFVWESSDDEVAAVTAGNNGWTCEIRGLKKGTTEIEVHSADGWSSCSWMLSVGEANRLVLSREELYLSLACEDGAYSGEDGILEASFLLDDPVPHPADRLNWSTDRSDVVACTVGDDGACIVSALSVGTALVTASTADNTYSATCRVYVRSAADGEVWAVRLPRREVRIGVGQIASLQAELLPVETEDDRIVWMSSNTDVVRMDVAGSQCVVTGTSIGTSVITASVGGKSARCVVHVGDEMAADVQAVYLDCEDRYLVTGETMRLIAAADPGIPKGTSYTWESSDMSVAEVDQTGLVTAASAGTAVITVALEGRSASCLVTVCESGLLPEDAPLAPRDELGRIRDDAVWIAGVEDKLYSGEPVTQEIRVYCGSSLLKENSDYTVSYANNRNAASRDSLRSPVLTVKGKGNYVKTTRAERFAIKPRSLREEYLSGNISVESPAVAWNGKEQKETPAVYWNGKKLKSGTDYVTEYGAAACVEAGEYLFTIRGKGNFLNTDDAILSGPEFKECIVNTSSGTEPRALISRTRVRAPGSVYYSGQAVTTISSGDLSVHDGDVLLKENVDYRVSYHNNGKVGKATLILTGEGRYVGEKRVSFSITGRPMRAVSIDAPDWKNKLVWQQGGVTQDEGKITLRFVSDGENSVLIPGTDYEVTYMGNDRVGTATVVYTGIGRYTGAIRRTFSVLPVDLAAAEAAGDLSVTGEDPPFMTGGAIADPTVVWKGQRLKKGVDYTLRCSQNKAVTKGKTDDRSGKGMPTVTIKGKGCFKGTIRRSFTIVRGSLYQVTIQTADKAYNGKPGKWRQSFRVRDVNGKTLKMGRDYRLVGYYCDGRLLADNDVPAIGSIILLRIVGMGNYDGERGVSYRLYAVKRALSGARISIADQEYTGKPVTLSADMTDASTGDIVVKLGDDYLKCGTDYVITGYRNNTGKGTARVTVRGIGRYGGTKTVSFRIRPKSFSNALFPVA